MIVRMTSSVAGIAHEIIAIVIEITLDILLVPIVMTGIETEMSDHDVIMIEIVTEITAVVEILIMHVLIVSIPVVEVIASAVLIGDTEMKTDLIREETAIATDIIIGIVETAIEKVTVEILMVTVLLVVVNIVVAVEVLNS